MSQSSSNKLGVSPAARTTKPIFPLGEITFGTDGEVLLYVQAAFDVAANISVTVDTTAFTIVTGAGLFKSGKAWVQGDYGWVAKVVAV